MQAPSFMKLLAIVAVIAIACSSAPAKPGCESSDLARINAAEQGELAYHCGGQGVDCAERERIHADYKQKREDWAVRCQD